MINPQFIRSSCCYVKPAQNSTVKSTLLSCDCNWLQQTPVGWVTARSLLNLIQVYSRGTYHKTEAPFGWKNQCWALDGLIHGCLQGMVAYVRRHAQNSPPFCCNQRGFAKERERETDGTYDYKITVTIGLDYNTMPPTETESCHFLAYKGMYSIIRSLFSFKVYIAVNYGGSNHQPAHVIRAPITSKYI